MREGRVCVFATAEVGGHDSNDRCSDLDVREGGR